MLLINFSGPKVTTRVVIPVSKIIIIVHVQHTHMNRGPTPFVSVSTSDDQKVHGGHSHSNQCSVKKTEGARTVWDPHHGRRWYSTGK